MSSALKKLVSLNTLIFVLAAVQFAWLVFFFYTGLGGALELVARVMSIALALQILFMYQQDYFYKWLPPFVNHLLVAVYLGVCAYSFIYFHYEFERIAIYSQGSFTQQDYIVGSLVFLLVMELSRLAHPILFWTNVFMVGYTLYGFLSPIDFFWHPGTSFRRVITSSTVEFSTGIYGIYGQLALTLIAAFLLLAGVANGFNAQHSMIRVVRLIARSRRLIPQTAVVGSSAIGLISGSGSANAAVVGTITIPLMMRYGVPGTFAAAVETAASMGGLIDPPMMGAAAFLMAEFLGVPYWDVVLRGFALAFVYYISIGVAVYLLCVRLLPGDKIAKPHVPLYDKVTTGIFFASVIYLVYLMGFVGKGELLAALYTAALMLSLLVPMFLYFKYVLKEPSSRRRNVARQHPARDRNACRDDVLSDAAAGDARHHDRPVHGHRLHQPHGRHADRPRGLEHHRHDLHGLGVRLAGGHRPAADGDLHHRCGGHRAADEGAGNKPLGCALLRVPAVGVGRAVAADLAHGRRLRADRQRIFHEDHVRSAEDLRADHAHDLRDLHPLQHGDDDGVAADRRYAARPRQHAGHYLCDVRTNASESRSSTSCCAVAWRQSRSW